MTTSVRSFSFPTTLKFLVAVLWLFARRVRRWITQQWLDLYYKTTWAMPLYFRLFPPTKKTWCALEKYGGGGEGGGILIPAQNVWKSNMQRLLLPSSSPNAFQARPDDVFLVSFPKSGTHMLSHLIMDMMWLHDPNRQAKLRYASCGEPGVYPHFLEFGHPMYKQHEQRLGTSSSGGRRFFQTHLPVDHFPDSPLRCGSKIIYLARNPKACTTSAWHFCNSKKRKLYSPTPQQLVDSEWNSSTQIYRGWHNHVFGWSRFVSQTSRSVLVLSFEDIVANPTQATAKIASFLGISLSATQIQEVTAS